MTWAKHNPVVPFPFPSPEVARLWELDYIAGLFVGEGNVPSRGLLGWPQWLRRRLHELGERVPATGEALARRRTEIRAELERLQWEDEDYLRAYPPNPSGPHVFGGARVALSRLAAITVTPPSDPDELSGWTAEYDAWLARFGNMGALDRSLMTRPALGVLLPVDAIAELELVPMLFAGASSRRGGSASAALQAARDASLPFVPVVRFYAAAKFREELPLTKRRWWEAYV